MNPASPKPTQQEGADILRGSYPRQPGATPGAATNTQRAFTPHGLLALEPSAWGFLFEPPAEPPSPSDRNGVTVVTIHGPLMHHADYWCDSYDSIRGRVAEAIARGKPVVLEISSPGGLVSGCFETARDIRAMADAAGVGLTAYVDGQATSAAYALACACDRIVLPDAAQVGSIGVIEALMDNRAGAEMWGTKAAIITSGARKADGHPLAGISDDAVAAAQSRVNMLAEIFFEWVAERRGTTADAVKALEAGLVLGKAALAPRLADAVMTRDQLYSALASGEAVSASAGANGAQQETSSMKLSEAIDALKKMAEGDDEDAAQAKKLLAALDDEKDTDDGDDKSKADDAGDDKDTDEKKDDDAKAIARRALATAEDTARETLLASRPDFTAEQRATLQRASLDVVRDAVKTWPKAATPKPAAATQVGFTRGATQVDPAGAPTATDASRDLAVRMGLAEATGVSPRVEGVFQRLPVMTRAQGRAELQRRAAAEQQKRQQAASR